MASLYDRKYGRGSSEKTDRSELQKPHGVAAALAAKVNHQQRAEEVKPVGPNQGQAAAAVTSTDEETAQEEPPEQYEYGNSEEDQERCQKSVQFARGVEQ